MKYIFPYSPEKGKQVISQIESKLAKDTLNYFAN